MGETATTNTNPGDGHDVPYKYAYFSQPTPQFASLRDTIDQFYAEFYARSDGTFPSIRAVAGNSDDTMPPGGPERYREVTTELLQFPARDGHKVELKVYRSTEARENATLVYKMHGGGWVVGTHETDGAENVYAVAEGGNVVVVSVDYRLAPENPFPTGISDCFDGLIWCKEHFRELGIDPEKIILSGSSAGANLAAVLAMEARNQRVTGVMGQVLHFPIICHPRFFPRDRYEYQSYEQNKETSVLVPRFMEQAYGAYLLNLQPDPRHSPLLAGSHSDLPPALIQIAGMDILRDEAFAYAEALQDSGVDVEVQAYTGVPHCFPAVCPTVSETAMFYERFTGFLRRLST